MPTELINILIQIPIVAVFVWYSSAMNKQFQEFLREERESRSKQMEAMTKALTEEIRGLSNMTNEHDKVVREGFSVLLDRIGKK